MGAIDTRLIHEVRQSRRHRGRNGRRERAPLYLAIDPDAWTVATSEDVFLAALDCARGSYQDGIVRGTESLSGSTLRGKAADWSSRYSASREALLDRMTARGVPWEEIVGSHGRRVLLLGDGHPGRDLATPAGGYLASLWELLGDNARSNQ